MSDEQATYSLGSLKLSKNEIDEFTNLITDRVVDNLTKYDIYVKKDSVAECNPQNQIHKFVTCDCCKSPIVGIRYKCLDCDNFDACKNCMISIAVKRHNPKHSWLELNYPLEPGSLIVVHLPHKKIDFGDKKGEEKSLLLSQVKSISSLSDDTVDVTKIDLKKISQSSNQNDLIPTPTVVNVNNSTDNVPPIESFLNIELDENKGGNINKPNVSKQIGNQSGGGEKLSNINEEINEAVNKEQISQDSSQSDLMSDQDDDYDHGFELISATGCCPDGQAETKRTKNDDNETTKISIIGDDKNKVAAKTTTSNGVSMSQLLKLESKEYESSGESVDGFEAVEDSDTDTHHSATDSNKLNRSIYMDSSSAPIQIDDYTSESLTDLTGPLNQPSNETPGSVQSSEISAESCGMGNQSGTLSHTKNKHTNLPFLGYPSEPNHVSSHASTVSSEDCNKSVISVEKSEPKSNRIMNNNEQPKQSSSKGNSSKTIISNVSDENKLKSTEYIKEEKMRIVKDPFGMFISQPEEAGVQNCKPIQNGHTDGHASEENSTSENPEFPLVDVWPETLSRMLNVALSKFDATLTSASSAFAAVPSANVSGYGYSYSNNAAESQSNEFENINVNSSVNVQTAINTRVMEQSKGKNPTASRGQDQNQTNSQALSINQDQSNKRPNFLDLDFEKTSETVQTSGHQSIFDRKLSNRDGEDNAWVDWIKTRTGSVLTQQPTRADDIKIPTTSGQNQQIPIPLPPPLSRSKTQSQRIGSPLVRPTRKSTSSQYYGIPYQPMEQTKTTSSQGSPYDVDRMMKNLDTLREMGFMDRETNGALLLKHDHNITLVIDELFKLKESVN